MLVRTRADADTVQARTNRHRDARRPPSRGGAQFVSTDYEVPDPRFGAVRREDPGRDTCTLQPNYRPARLSPDRHRGPKSAQHKPGRSERDQDESLRESASGKAGSHFPI